MFRSRLFVTWLCILGIGCAAARCSFWWHSNRWFKWFRYPGDYIGARIDEGSSYDCPPDEPGGQCVALVKCLCDLPATSYWRKGQKVSESCDSIPRYTPVATFNGSGGTRYASGYGTGHAAIFVDCNDSGVTVLDQACGMSIRKRRYKKGSAFYEGFYTITCSGSCSPYPKSNCKLNGSR